MAAHELRARRGGATRAPNAAGRAPLPARRSTRSDVRNNSIGGDLPAAWASLPLLYHLDASQNALNATLPSAYGRLGALQLLDVSDNRLAGSLPPSWAGMGLIEVRLRAAGYTRC